MIVNRRVSVSGGKMNEHCTDMQRLIMMIRQYLSKQNSSIKEPVNSIFEVERSLREYRSFDNTCTIADENLRRILCFEALRLGMILYFGDDYRNFAKR
ncbi:hypothetical protein H3V17_00525 [Bartonella sp. M0283]|uniref:hypothetical protein n=1 Tax=Bartonella sp. M0283 TaxID=2751016 RepID=UPI0018DC0D9F|nr:hypothetical protein [Bartonella sp. M0283]MBI0162138.1 hypothetical protein [Bartonella sp. M0283]